MTVEIQRNYFESTICLLFIQSPSKFEIEPSALCSDFEKFGDICMYIVHGFCLAGQYYYELEYAIEDDIGDCPDCLRPPNSPSVSDGASIATGAEESAGGTSRRPPASAS